MICAESADCARRNAHHGAGFSSPDAFSIRTGTHVDRVLQHTGNRAVVFRRHEQEAVKRLYALSELCPRCRRFSLIIVVLVVEWKSADLDDFKLQWFRGQ